MKAFDINITDGLDDVATSGVTNYRIGPHRTIPDCTGLDLSAWTSKLHASWVG